MEPETLHDEILPTEKTLGVSEWLPKALGIAFLGALLIYGLYTLVTYRNTPAPAAAPVTRNNGEPETPRAVADVSILGTQSPSDEPGAITADIESTQLDTFDTEWTAISAEVDSFETKTHAP